jgi:hypothetical protein
VDKVSYGGSSIWMDAHILARPIEPAGHRLFHISARSPALIGTPALPQFDQRGLLAQAACERSLKACIAEVSISQLKQADKPHSDQCSTIDATRAADAVESSRVGLARSSGTSRWCSLA